MIIHVIESRELVHRAREDKLIKRIDRKSRINTLNTFIVIQVCITRWLKWSMNLDLIRS